MRRLYIAVSVLISAGCSHMQAAPAVPSVLVREAAGTKSKFVALYAFKGEPDGAVPVDGVSAIGNTLYGTTNYGGDSAPACYPGNGCGTAFSVTTVGKETVLYKFSKPGNGLRPYASLTPLSTTLYGTTERGGHNGNGAIFAIAGTGAETVVFSFNGTNGEYPRATLLNVNGVLYGTTYLGGRAGVGTAFSLKTSTSGKYEEKTLHHFQGYDGAQPAGNLIEDNGTLYGTTVLGGASNVGTVFQIDASGKESVLYSFKGGTDGSEPYAGLTDVNGTLYGTTYYGGTSGKGTVFAVTATGVESVVHSFTGGTDGAQPIGGLTVLNGTLYGTTSNGGANSDGTIYAITSASGSETIVHTFKGSDGDHPAGNLTAVGSALYGTTTKGGSTSRGTVFKFSP